MSRVLFIGGPGNISTSTIEELLARGHEVRIYTRPKSSMHGLEMEDSGWLEKSRSGAVLS